MTAADMAVMVAKEAETAPERLANYEAVALRTGATPEQARQLALVRYMHEYTEALLSANNRKIAADLVRLGVLTGTLTRDGEASF